MAGGVKTDEKVRGLRLKLLPDAIANVVRRTRETHEVSLADRLNASVISTVTEAVTQGAVVLSHITDPKADDLEVVAVVRAKAKTWEGKNVLKFGKSRFYVMTRPGIVTPIKRGGDNIERLDYSGSRRMSNLTAYRDYIA